MRTGARTPSELSLPLVTPTRSTATCVSESDCATRVKDLDSPLFPINDDTGQAAGQQRVTPPLSGFGQATKE
jgi:hypothetical protein